jgi:hypothetical protein
LQQYLGSDTAAQQAYLQANAAGLSAYFTSNPTVLSAFLGSDPAEFDAVERIAVGDRLGLLLRLRGRLHRVPWWHQPV